MVEDIKKIKQSKKYNIPASTLNAYKEAARGNGFRVSPSGKAVDGEIKVTVTKIKK